MYIKYINPEEIESYVNDEERHKKHIINIEMLLFNYNLFQKLFPQHLFHYFDNCLFTEQGKMCIIL